LNTVGEASKEVVCDETEVENATSRRQRYARVDMVRERRLDKGEK